MTCSHIRLFTLSVVLCAAAVSVHAGWTRVVVSTNAQEAWGSPGMAVDTNGYAGFAYRTPWVSTPVNIHALYRHESSLGVLDAEEEIAFGDRGFFATMTYNGLEPHVVLHRSPDVGAGAGYFSKEGGIWSSETVVTNLEGRCREPVSFSAGRPNVIVVGPDSVLHYYRGNASGVFEEHAIGTPINISGVDAPLQMFVGTDDRVRIAASGPGAGDDQIWLGTETAAGSAAFTWVQVCSGDYWAHIIGFAMDENNCAYITAKRQSTGNCAVLDNATGGWRVTELSTIDATYPRTAVAVDPSTNAWAIYNGRDAGNVRHVAVWGNESGSWQPYPDVTNSTDNSYFIQAIPGFAFSPDGTAKLGLFPEYDAKRIEMWYWQPGSEPQPPTFSTVEYTPYPTPVETRDVTVHAIVVSENANVTNVTFEYQVDGGGFLGPFAMSTNTTPSDFYYSIPTQAVGAAVDFKLSAYNDAGQTSTSEAYRYTVYEDLMWQMVMVATDLPQGNKMPAMALDTDGYAAFVYRQGSNHAQYVEETSLGVFGLPVAISSEMEGYDANLVFGADGEPRASLSHDSNGGVSFVQRTNGVWVSPTLVVTNTLDEWRNDLTLTDGKPSILFYENGINPEGLLCDGDTQGTSFFYTAMTSPPTPTTPNELRRSFAILTGNDSRRRIVISGPGGGDDQIWFGTEEAAGSATFTWVPVSMSNVYAEQIGFALDAENHAYIACRDISTNHAVVFWNSSGAWQKRHLDYMEHWNRSAIAIDPNSNAWVVCNSAGAWGASRINLWSNRSGDWAREQAVTNGVFVETFAGFEITDLGTMKLGIAPDVDSSELWYMYSTKFTIPEPGMLFLIGYLTFGFWHRQRIASAQVGSA